ncbi:hypothetical protein QFZ99_007749 [Paraburkholderia atlantica]
MPFPRRLSSLCRFRRERAHVSQVVGRLNQQEKLVNSLQSPQYRLHDSCSRLAPAKTYSMQLRLR